MKKRLLSILLIFCMVLTMIPVGGVFAADDPNTIVCNGITYTCTTDGSNDTATVTRCNVNASGENGRIEIPSSVKYNGEDYTVTGIGVGAFSNCTGLTGITFADGSQITSIGDRAFYNCTGLTSIKIPNSVTVIGENAFFKCAIKDVATGSFTGLTSITFEPNSELTSIGEYAFSECTALKSIEIPNKVTSIGDRAFDGCRGLTSITIPNEVKTISAYTFSGCTGLTSITIPNSVETIGDSAFNGCIGLTSITIPDSVNSIAGNAFYGCSNLDNINVGQNSYFYFDNVGKVLFNKEKTMLVAYLHSGANSSYIIPESVTSIGNSAFSGCTDLTSITIPNSVKTIGVFAFSSCKNLKSITIPNSVKTIGESAFSSCTELTSITFAADSQLTSIGDETFYGCSALKSIEIPNSVETIGKSAFSECSRLTSITFASGSQLKSIENNAFEACNKLTIVIYGDNAHNNTTLTSKFPDGIFFAAKPEFGVERITTDSVTLKVITGATNNSGETLTVKYRVAETDIKKGWKEGKEGTEFTRLNPDTEYTFQVGFFDNSSDKQPKVVYELAPVRTAKKTPSYTPPANPTIDITGKEGGTVIYDRIRHTVTITPNDNYLVKEITINGTTVPVTDGAMVLENIYGWSRISVTFEPKPEPAFEPDKYISELKFKASSSKTSKGNIRIKVTSVTDDNGNKIDLTELKDKGYTVKFKYYRSTKKASKYTAKVEKDADINSYINTVGKKGTKYYYKVRVMVYDADGNLVAKSDLKQCSYAARTWSK